VQRALGGRVSHYEKWSRTTSTPAAKIVSSVTTSRGIGYELVSVLAQSSPLRDGDGALRVDREEPVVTPRREV
jgi:hypothetical protein